MRVYRLFNNGLLITKTGVTIHKMHTRVSEKIKN